MAGCARDPWQGPNLALPANGVRDAHGATQSLALLETEAMDWHRDLVLAMGWSVFALTLGGSSLLYLLIQRGAATRVSSLMYLVPPCTAIMAWLMFDEPITVRVVAGVVITAAGVSLVLRDGPTRSR